MAGDPRVIHWQTIDGDGYWQHLKQADVIEWCEPLLQSGYHLRDSDGKIEGTPRMAWDTPWHHVKHAHGFNCALFHQIMFNVIFPKLSKKWVPAFCHQCYKVVARPKTLRQLFAMIELQKRLDLPSKSGIEPRDTTNGLYGSYWYNFGLEAGLECYKLIRKEINADKLLGPDVDVILKRACTEYELKCGPSDKWELSQEQLEVENLVSMWVATDTVLRSQPEHVVARVHRRWVEWAYAAGDQTYLEYTNGQRLFPALVTYHHLAENEKPKTAARKKAKK